MWFNPGAETDGGGAAMATQAIETAFATIQSIVSLIASLPGVTPAVG